MTRDEARLTLQDNFGYLSQEHPRILEALRVALDALSQPSLPSNLNEAAEEYAYTNWEDNDYHTGASEGLPFDAIGHTEKCFRAGAEWMAGQGYTKEGIARPDDCEIWVNFTNTDLKDGDEVIVQIRKNR